MRTLYLRNVPDEVVDRLERLAAREATSVSALAVRELAEVSRRVDNPAILDALPDLVVADHGWAGAAGEAGVSVIGFADSNDPGLFLGQEEGKVAVVVPLDDNVSPHLYGPLIEYLRHAAGL